MKLTTHKFIDFESKNKLTQKVWLVVLMFIAVYVVYNIFILFSSAFFGVFYAIMNPESAMDLESMMSSDSIKVFSLFVTTFGIIIALVYVRFIESRPLSSTGIIKKNIFLQYGMGYLLGIVMIGIPALALILFNGSIRLNAEVSYGLLLLYFIGFLIQGASEEILIRGYLFTSLKKTTNMFWAIALSSLAFALMHMSNPNMGVLPFVNLFLFGVFACFFFLRTKNIWAISALHSAWNFFQGNIFGIEVSGQVFKSSLFSIDSAASAFLSGGSFGLEGGIMVTALLIAATVITIFCGKNNLIAKKEEMQDSAE